jgi:hypothetical protein
MLEKQGTTVSLPAKNTYILYKVDEISGKIERLRTIKGDATLKEKGVFWFKKK